jgi:hypothetical protein
MSWRRRTAISGEKPTSWKVGWPPYIFAMTEGLAGLSTRPSDSKKVLWRCGGGSAISSRKLLMLQLGIYG